MTTRTRSRALSVFVILGAGVTGCLLGLGLPGRDAAHAAAPTIGETTLSAAAQPARERSAADTSRDKEAEADLNVARSLSRAFNRAAGAVSPAVVHVTQIRDVNVMRGWDVETQPMAVGAGSGVILSPDGYVLTNNHVIEGARAVRVKLADGREFDGSVVGADPATDLGVVRVNATGLPVASWGDDDALSVGEWVVAIGSPFGQFDNTVTSGIISAKNRTGLSGPRDERFEDFIQTDAAINPGNSGGPLVNLEGKVVGINSQIATRTGGNVGIGFSIPASIARPVMEMIVRNNGRVERGWIGVGMSDDAVDGGKGVLLARVVPGGPASKAGLKPEDVLVRFNGREVDTSNRLRNAIAFTPPGTEAPVELIRNGDHVTTTVKVVDTTQGRSMVPGGMAVSRYGFAVETIRAESTRRLIESDAVIVNYVSRLSPSGEAGLQSNDVIQRVNGKSVESAADFDETIRQARGRLRLDVLRPSTGQRGYILVEAENAPKRAD